MANPIRSWVERLSAQALPAMALTRKRVPQLLNSPNTNNLDLQRVIARDPGFSLAIYRAFSNHPHPPKEPITNLAHAISLLGIEPMTRASNQLPVLNEQLKGEARTALYACYSRSAHAAWYALNWGRQLKLHNPEEMAIAALLLELGEMMLWSHAAQEMSEIIALQRRGMTAKTAEQTLLGFELSELSIQLAEAWKLPGLLIEALRPAGAFNTRSLTVMLASALAIESASNWHSEETDDLVELAAELHGVERDQGYADIHSLAAGAAHNLHGLPVPLAVYGLLQPRPASPPLAEPRPLKQSKAPEPEKSATTKQPLREEAPQKEPPVSTTTPTVDADTTPLARQAPPASPPKTASNEGSNPLQQRLSRLFNDIKESTGADRVMFAMLTADKTQLKAKFTVGTEKDSPLRSFNHPMGERHLFTLMMKKPQGIWLNRENQGKLTPLISEQSRLALDTRGFYMSSLFINNRPMGILYADRSDPEFLDKHGFSQFKSLAQRLCNELGQKK
ncbi:MAG: HDOD domain-containing protein [Sedimenticola sp.]|nr:HDOD domain-containing protein [Sedimenticola sp.]